MSTWITPKTDWKATDFFNASDYNRIIGNIEYIRELADTVLEGFEITSMGAEKDYTSLIYAREMNVIEANVDIVNANTYNLDIGSATEYVPNGNTPTFEEFNRIESACLLIYNTLTAHITALPRLSFTLGTQRGVKP